MKSTNYAILLIKSFEQLRLNSYLCPAGKWTIGYGHTDGVNRGMLITEKTADAFLKQDIKHAEQAVNEVDADLTQEQFDALVSFVFNVGVQAFRVSTLRKLVERNPNDPKIADEFRRWVYAGDKKLPGLIKRREQEIKLYYSYKHHHHGNANYNHNHRLSGADDNSRCRLACRQAQASQRRPKVDARLHQHPEHGKQAPHRGPDDRQ